MSIYDNFQITTNDNTDITVHKWVPQKIEVQGIILILHGMAEHAKRYDDFAKFLNKHGFVIYAPDHRGHGMTGKNNGHMGFFSQSDGWQQVVEDINIIIKNIKKSYSDLPLILFGHSMGSLLARTCIFQFGNEFRGVIISGTTIGKNTLTTKIGRLLALHYIKKDGSYAQADKLNKMSFESYNKFFKPNITEFDWLSRDSEKVKEYISDPLCGFTCSSTFFRDLFDGLIALKNINNIRNIPNDLPIYIFSGAKDPVGNLGKEIKKVYKMYLKSGLKNVSYKLYEDGRHEMINEINRMQVYEDCLKWVTESCLSEKPHTQTEI